MASGFKIPKLNKICVENYSFFEEENWEYELKNGFNIFIGANGLGKTTTVKMVIWGFVGFDEDFEDDIEKDYFSTRDDGYSEDSPPTVTISAEFDDTQFLIERRLDCDEIIHLEIGDESFSDNLKNEYENFIEDKTTYSLSDFSFLLRQFLVRIEEGNYLLWDTASQSKLLRLLLNESSFDDEYRKQKQNVQDFETTRKHLSEDMRKIEEDIETIKGLIKENLEVSGDQDIEELQTSLANLEEEKSSIEKEKQELVSEYHRLNEEIQIKENRINSLTNELSEMTERVSSVEHNFYANILSNPAQILAANKFSEYNICMFCESDLNKEQAERVLELIEERHQCPVCKSSLVEDESKESSSEVDFSIEEMNDIYEDKNEIVEEREDLIYEVNELKKEREPLQEGISRIDESLKEIQSQIDQKLLSLNEKLDDGQTDKMSTYETDLKAFQRKLNALKDRYDEADDAFRQEKESLNDLNEQFNQKVEEVSEALSEKFNEYAEYFFSEKCILNQKNLSPKGTHVQLVTFRPQIEDKVRTYSNSVSKSEAVFLEYIFRMSLVEVYSERINQQIFFILETSEGTFDVVSTKQFGLVIDKFSGNDFPFIIVSNLSKPDFLHSMVEGMDDIKERSLNFLNIGKFSTLQQEHIEEFKTNFSQIFEEGN